MEKTNTKRIVFISCIIALVIGLVSYTAITYKKYNSFYETKTKNAEVLNSPDSDIPDVNFYKCIVNWFNKYYTRSDIEITNKKGYEYGEIISNEDLNQLEGLNCFGKAEEISNTESRKLDSIESIKGIEKMTNLTYITLTRNKLKEFNVANTNPKLKKIILADNLIENFNFEPAPQLTYLDLSRDHDDGIPIFIDEKNINMSKIDLSKYVNLDSLTLSGSSMMGTLNTTKMLNLRSLNISYTDISNINLTNNKYLQTLLANNTKITEINTLNNSNLKNMIIFNNNYKINDIYLKIGQESSVTSPISTTLGYTLTTADKEIISINNNKIKALKEGTATVTVTYPQKIVIKFDVIVESNKTENKETEAKKETTTVDDSNSKNEGEDSSSKTNTNSNTKVNTKNLNGDNTLKSLEIKEKTIEFDKDVLEYNVTVDNKIKKVNVIAIPNNKKSIVETTVPDELELGENIALIKVLAENGSSKTYQLNIKKLNVTEKPSADNNLKSLIVDGYILNFKSKQTEYTIIINNIEKLDIAYVSSNENASVTIKGNKNLKNGSKVNVIVVAENGNKKTYTIRIRKQSKLLNYILAIFIVLISTFFIYYYLNKKNKTNENIKIIE